VTEIAYCRRLFFCVPSGVIVRVVVAEEFVARSFNGASRPTRPADDVDSGAALFRQGA